MPAALGLSMQLSGGAEAPSDRAFVETADSRMPRARFTVEPPPYHVPSSSTRFTVGSAAIAESATPKDVPSTTWPCFFRRSFGASG